MGLHAVAFDRDRAKDATGRGDSEDILSKQGFTLALTYVMRLAPAGLLWMAPVCSSFNNFLNQVNTQRRSAQGYTGATNYQPVREGNAMARIAVFLFTVAWARMVEAVIENPVDSVLFKYTPVRDTLAKVEGPGCRVVTPRCAFSTEAFGRRPYKLYRFVATGSWITSLRRRCSCPGKEHMKLTVRKVVNGRVQITGIKTALVYSASYPRALGHAVAASWLAKPADLPLVQGPGSLGVAKSAQPPRKPVGSSRSSGKKRRWKQPDFEQQGQHEPAKGTTWHWTKPDIGIPEHTARPASSSASRQHQAWKTPPM